MARTVRKLVSGDPDYDAGLDKFEVTETGVINTSAVNTCSIADVQAKIDLMSARKAAEVARWDEKIAVLDQLKLDLQAEV